MPSGLPVSRIVNVQSTLSPIAAGTRNFGVLNVVGATDVIDVGERTRGYSNLDGVAQDFAGTDPEYLAASLYFSQAPQPTPIRITRWAKTATRAVLNGGVLSVSEQLLSNFTTITNGSLSLPVNGATVNATGLNFSAATNLNGVASIIQAALTGTTVVWDAVRKRFVIRTVATGATATLGYAGTPASGTNISSLIKVTSALASAPVAGMAAESALAAVQAAANAEGDWYGVTVADASLTNTDHLQIAGYIEGLARKRVYGVWTTATTAIDPTSTTDIAAVLSQAKYGRSTVQYSAVPYAVASMVGRGFTVNFNADNTTLTLKFKQEPGVPPESLTESQADALIAKNCNVFVRYDNNTSIIQEGVMCSGIYFDERHGIDWFENDVQTGYFNALYTSPTKIPQTDAGMEIFAAVATQSCGRAVANGLVAPGIWNGPPIGSLRTGDYMTDGYYVYTPPVSTQSQADREARRAVPTQIALKLAGAVHRADVLVTFNR